MAFIPPTHLFRVSRRSGATTCYRFTPKPSFTSRHIFTMTASSAQEATTTASAQETIETAWGKFAEKMSQSGEIPAYEEWHSLLDVCIATNEQPSKAVWVLNLMRETGRVPTAVTYEKVLQLCADQDDKDAAFHLVEGMFGDKVLLGDVELPEGMEKILRKILPPEAFE